MGLEGNVDEDKGYRASFEDDKNLLRLTVVDARL